MTTQPFLGEIQAMAFNFPPRGWAQCNGQVLPIAQNQALFSLLGTTYGGDGQVNFGLPDLRGRVPVHIGTAAGQPGVVMGQKAGEERHTLLVTEMPQHNHLLRTNTSVDALSNSNTAAAGNTLGQSIGSTNNTNFPVNIYASSLSSPTALSPGMVGNAGGSQSHENRQPFTTLNICIAIQGIFPSRN